MSEEILDLKELLERVQDDKELLLELLDIFSEDFRGKRETLSEAVNNEDYEQIKNIAHSLKGASGNISAKSLRAVCFQLEEVCKNSDQAGAQESLSLMDEQFAALSERMASVKEELS